MRYMERVLNLILVDSLQTVKIYQKPEYSLRLIITPGTNDIFSSALSSAQAEVIVWKNLRRHSVRLYVRPSVRPSVSITTAQI